ncbi:NADP(H)-dependent aldo-keto reductase [Paraferrimonas sp. SM1919]|uniref:NADP(H)-dependent aldo-keto reductase n=1 Tax=Paraferrimonas sp. SM1919 TaxID=2662263 RepID=UPI0013D64825|nr:NADP(H)-dependent aldo-keto reductase [Paraferrimonas sp. SM1919]
MQHKKLGRTTLNVSPICLGTMTFGAQNNIEEAIAQLTYATANGVNFIDTAEMYPIPPSPVTQGDTERFIGEFLQQRGQRDDLVIATKVAAPGGVNYIRGDHDNMSLNWRNIHKACDDSLARLNTDYIDLYQVHWPDRNVNSFGQLNYQAQESEKQTPIVETLEALADLQKQGKIRYIGISNETPWGTMQYLHLADKHGLPRIATIQNPYNLLNRSFEVGLAEVAHREELPLLAYSPLAFGMLTGKYLGGAKPQNARLTLFERFARYTKTDNAWNATKAYCELAADHGLSPAQLALAYVNSRPFVGSNIIGATSLEQLKENIDSANIVLGDDVQKQIEQLGIQFSNPCP